MTALSACHTASESTPSTATGEVTRTARTVSELSGGAAKAQVTAARQSSDTIRAGRKGGAPRVLGSGLVWTAGCPTGTEAERLQAPGRSAGAGKEAADARQDGGARPGPQRDRDERGQSRDERSAPPCGRMATGQGGGLGAVGCPHARCCLGSILVPRRGGKGSPRGSSPGGSLPSQLPPCGSPASSERTSARSSSRPAAFLDAIRSLLLTTKKSCPA